MSQSVKLPLVKILSYFSLIERNVPVVDNFSFYTPSISFNPFDTISIQSEARRMMEFIGLRGYTTVVSICSTKKGTAGNINLNDSKDVFIEIDGNMSSTRKYYKEAVLCVLAHEICHKYLYFHRVYLEDSIENEYCTDLATFYVGFGLLTINGCYEEESHTIHFSNGRSETTTRTSSTGYLTPQTYLIAHQIVCKVHGFDCQKGIRSEMYNIISRTHKDSIESTPISREALIEKFKEQSASVAHKKKELTIMKALIAQKEKELYEEYKRIDNDFSKLILFKNSAEIMPFSTMNVLHRASKKLESTEFSWFIPFINSKYHSLLESKLLEVTCPFCGVVASTPLKEHNQSIRKCQCGKVFYWDSTSSFSSPRDYTKERIRNTKTKESVANRIIK